MFRVVEGSRRCVLDRQGSGPCDCEGLGFAASGLSNLSRARETETTDPKTALDALNKRPEAKKQSTLTLQTL